MRASAGVEWELAGEEEGAERGAGSYRHQCREPHWALDSEECGGRRVYMMTVAEAELVRRAAEKGRSASFCAPSQPLSALHSAHSSSDIPMDARAQAAALVHAQVQQQQSTSRTRLKPTQSARRSQSCRVQGSRQPRVRRQESPRGSEPRLELDADASAAFMGAKPPETSSYNPFLRKVPSCGRLVTLAPDGGSGEEADSPVLRRSASARRPPTSSSPNHSPTPTRITRPIQKSRPSTKRPPASGNARRGAGGTSGAGFLDVKPSGSNEGLDPDSYLLRNFSTTTKGEYRLAFAPPSYSSNWHSVLSKSCEGKWWKG